MPALPSASPILTRSQKDLPAEEPRHLAGLAPCSVCSRRFAANRLGTHVIICARLAARAAAPSRKAYPTTMQTRLAGTDFFAYHPSALPRSTTETAAAVDSHVGAASQQSMHTKRPRDVCASNDATATQSIAQPRSVYHTGTSKAVLPPQTLSQGATWREQRAQLRRGLGLDAAHALKVAKAAMQVNSEYGLAPPDPPWLHATRIGDSVEICGRDGLVGYVSVMEVALDMRPRVHDLCSLSKSSPMQCDAISRPCLGSWTWDMAWNRIH